MIPAWGHQLKEISMGKQWDFLHLMYSVGEGWVSPCDGDFSPLFFANWFLFVHPTLASMIFKVYFQPEWLYGSMITLHSCFANEGGCWWLSVLSIPILGQGTRLNAFSSFQRCCLKQTPVFYTAKLHLSERLQKPVQIDVPCFWLTLPIFYCHMFVSCRTGKEKHLSTSLSKREFFSPVLRDSTQSMSKKSNVRVFSHLKMVFRY